MNNLRPQITEQLDHPDFGGEHLHRVLGDLERINRLLFNHLHIKKAFAKCMGGHTQVRLTDFGCGGGDVLRKLVDFSRKKGIAIQALGLDHNEQVLAYAKWKSADYPEIRFERWDAHSTSHDLSPCDVAVSSQFMYHLEDDELIALLGRIRSNSTLAVIISEVENHRLAARVFPLFARCLRLDPTSLSDGLNSMKSGFTASQLKSLAHRLPGNWNAKRYIPFRLLLTHNHSNTAP